MNEQNQQKYQLICILDPALDEEFRIGLINRIKEKIAKKQGTIEKEPHQPEELKKARLSYLINKTREAYYWEVHLLISAEGANYLQKELNLEKGIIRFLITRKPDKEPEQKQIPKQEFDFNIIDKIEPVKSSEQTKDESPVEETGQPEKTEKPEQKESSSKAKIEDLDKKLDEILKQ